MNTKPRDPTTSESGVGWMTNFTNLRASRWERGVPGSFRPRATGGNGAIRASGGADGSVKVGCYRQTPGIRWGVGCKCCVRNHKWTQIGQRPENPTSCLWLRNRKARKPKAPHGRPNWSKYHKSQDITVTSQAAPQHPNTPTPETLNLPWPPL